MLVADPRTVRRQSQYIDRGLGGRGGLRGVAGHGQCTRQRVEFGGHGVGVAVLPGGQLLFGANHIGGAQHPVVLAGPRGIGGVGCTRESASFAD